MPIKNLFSKPKRVLFKPITIDAGKFFRASLKVAVHTATGKWQDAAIDFGELIGATGLETKPEELAWILVQKALLASFLEIAIESEVADVMSRPDLDQVWNKAFPDDLVIDSQLFDSPGKLKIVEIAAEFLKEWLLLKGLNSARATTVQARYASYFLYALQSEYVKNADRYAPVTALLIQNPLAAAVKRDQEWSHYASWLAKQVGGSMLNETFSLLQVYVPLRSYYETYVASDEHTGNRSLKRRVVDLQREIDSWLTSSIAGDFFRVISGGPGSGKSSFCKMYAAHVATTIPGYNVILVPLHLFDVGLDIEGGLIQFLRSSGMLSFNPLETIEKPLLLIFDGLDELSMQGKAGFEVVQSFVRQLDTVLSRTNIKSIRAKAILSGRKLAIQSQAPEFMTPRQVQHLLPFLLTGRELEDHQLFEGMTSLGLDDQRHEWWQKYGIAVGVDYRGVPDSVNRQELREITSEPLLCYLLALSYERGEIRFDQRGKFNLNSIYGDLLSAVYARSYAGKPHPGVRDISETDFIRILEEIGLSSWHGQGRTTSVSEIEAHCTESSLSELLEKFQDGAKGGVARMLMAFYFRQGGNRKDGEPSFEFTHKSFGEYLTARRIIRLLRRVVDQTQRRAEDHDDGIDDRTALNDITEICGPMTIDTYIFAFIVNEIGLMPLPKVRDWQATLARLVGVTLREQLPLERQVPRLSFQKELKYHRNTMEALLALSNATGRVTGDLTNVPWPEENSACQLLQLLCATSITKESHLSWSALATLISPSRRSKASI